MTDDRRERYREASRRWKRHNRARNRARDRDHYRRKQGAIAPLPAPSPFHLRRHD